MGLLSIVDLADEGTNKVHRELIIQTLRLVGHDLVLSIGGLPLWQPGESCEGSHRKSLERTGYMVSLPL